MNISQASVEWALDFIIASSDSDLFPPTPEFEAVQREEFIEAIANTELAALSVGPYRRFLVPKDEYSYRQATQLDPQDSLVLTALVHEWGGGIESRRLPATQVFSYRYAPGKSDLYDEHTGWNDFWQAVETESRNHQFAVYCDIADFYNQIYHHPLENQLIASGLPNQVMKWILGLCASTTAGVSRGLPIGPHAMHLLAESTLIPIDNALVAHGLRFVRYSDDYVFFADSEIEARSVLAMMAQTLDKQQRLTLQRHKSKILKGFEARFLAHRMIQDQPISEAENDLLAIVRKYSRGDPYRTVWFSEIDYGDWSSITPSTLEAIINAYLRATQVDYIRLGWFFRRLAQIGHPGALAITLDRIPDLLPCLPSVIRYVSAVQSVDSAVWLQVGQQLAGLLNSVLVENQEYYEVMLLSLYARNRDMNHFDLIGRRFRAATPAGRRQIILMAQENEVVDWLRELKEDFPSMDPGQRLAFIYSMRLFPKDERKFFLNLHQGALTRPLEIALVKLAKG